MKKLLNTICLLLFMSLLVPSGGRAASVEEEYQAIRDEYVALLGSSQAQRQRQSWLDVAAKLEAFADSPRAGRRADDARYLLGRTWHGLSRASGNADDARRAMAIYEQLAESNPDSNLADDALIYAAEIAQETFSDTGAAYNYYLKITTDLPPGDMLGEAQSRLKRLARVAPAPPVESPEAKVSPRKGNGELTKIRVWSSPDYTRVVLDLSVDAAYEPHQLGGREPRIYVDLAGLRLGEDIPANLEVGDGIVDRIRCSNLDDSTVRVVLDLGRDGDFKAFHLENPERVVIDVRKPTDLASPPEEIKALPGSGKDSIAGILNNSKDRPLPDLPVPQHNGKQGIRLIVVDAGHGGKDPGAIGPGNTREKDVTLQLARQLAAALRKELGCKVLMTRNDDTYLGLHERTDYANKVEADLFISLHANASPNSGAYGLETYYLNLSKNNQAAEVAARENGTSLEEVSNLEAILFDLMANAKINESSRLASEIQQSLVNQLDPKYKRIKNLGVRQGPFHVLLGATMPSVLVETAFISNRREEKRLMTPAYQKSVAQAIVRGVRKYSESIQQMARQ